MYVLVDVVDDSVIRHDSEFPRTDASDHVEIALVSADDEFLRFAIHEAGDGVGAGLPGPGRRRRTLPDSRIEAALVETDEGYRVEARIPRTLMGTQLSLAVIDVDDRAERWSSRRAGTSGTERREDLGRVVVPSPELAALAQGLGRARSRLWVVDARGQRARPGGIAAGNASAPGTRPRGGSASSWNCGRSTGPFSSSPPRTSPTRARTQPASKGRNSPAPSTGESASWRRRTTDGRAAVLSAAEPVWSEGKVVGAVLAEETTNETLAARNRAFERLFFSIAFVVLFGALTLLAFATRLSFRIRRLRDAVERAIDRHGRVKGEIPQSSAQDEIGDLSRSFGSMLERQQQYTAYLEDLRSRLSHEIRTPVAVVRSSLDNLRLQNPPAPAAVYLDRADEGLSRLVTIVQRMTEASRLEQTLATSDREPFDLARVVSGCVEGYRLANPGRRIDYIGETRAEPMTVLGAPDLVAQLLDKLVENALDFARDGYRGRGAADPGPRRRLAGGEQRGPADPRRGREQAVRLDDLVAAQGPHGQGPPRSRAHHRRARSRTSTRRR